MPLTKQKYMSKSLPLKNLLSKTILLCLLLTYQFTLKAEIPLEASYTLQFDETRPSLVHVTADLNLQKNTLRMASWGHPNLPMGWATFVKNLKVLDDEGRELPLQSAGKDSWGAWKVSHENGTRIHLSYDVELSHHRHDWSAAGGQDSRPSINGKALFLVTKALFIYPPELESAHIAIDAPDHWKISSPWPDLPNKPRQFYAGTWISLINNALVVGEHDQRKIEDDNMTIILALDKSLSAHANLFEETFTKQLSAYRKLFKGTPSTQYLVTIRAENEDDGESFENSFNQVITPSRITERKVVWANTMGHELFHYWNGNHVLVGKDKSSIEWFGEGFTEYYASLTLFRTGMIDETLYFKKLERYFSRYFISTRMWPVEALSLVAAGKEKHKNWLRVYGGGATIALVLDIKIRSATNQRKSLDDVMLDLKNKFGAPGSRYTVADILTSVNNVSGANFDEFFAMHITNLNGQLDLKGILSLAGIHVDQFADEYYLERSTDMTSQETAMYKAMYHSVD